MSLSIAEWAFSNNKVDLESYIDVISCYPILSKKVKIITSREDQEKWFAKLTDETVNEKDLVSRLALLEAWIQTKNAADIGVYTKKILKFIAYWMRNDALKHIHRISLFKFLFYLVESLYNQQVNSEDNDTILQLIIDDLSRQSEYSDARKTCIIIELYCILEIIEKSEHGFGNKFSKLENLLTRYFSSSTEELRNNAVHIISLQYCKLREKNASNLFLSSMLEAHYLLEDAWPDETIDMKPFATSARDHTFFVKDFPLNCVDLQMYRNKLDLARSISFKYDSLCVLLSYIIKYSRERVCTFPLRNILSLFERVISIDPNPQLLEINDLAVAPDDGRLNPAVMQIIFPNLLTSTLKLMKAISTLPKSAMLQLSYRFGRVLKSYLNYNSMNEDIFQTLSDIASSAITTLGATSAKCMIAPLLPTLFQTIFESLRHFFSENHHLAIFEKFDSRTGKISFSEMSDTNLENGQQSRFIELKFRTKYFSGLLSLLSNCFLNGGRAINSKLVSTINDIAVLTMMLLKSTNDEHLDAPIILQFMKFSKFCLLNTINEMNYNRLLAELSLSVFRAKQMSSNHTVAKFSTECLRILSAIIHPKTTTLIEWNHVSKSSNVVSVNSASSSRNIFEGEYDTLQLKKYSANSNNQNDDLHNELNQDQIRGEKMLIHDVELENSNKSYLSLENENAKDSESIVSGSVVTKGSSEPNMEKQQDQGGILSSSNDIQSPYFEDNNSSKIIQDSLKIKIVQTSMNDCADNCKNISQSLENESESNIQITSSERCSNEYVTEEHLAPLMSNKTNENITDDKSLKLVVENDSNIEENSIGMKRKLSNKSSEKDEKLIKVESEVQRNKSIQSTAETRGASIFGLKSVIDERSQILSETNMQDEIDLTISEKDSNESDFLLIDDDDDMDTEQSEG